MAGHPRSGWEGHAPAPRSDSRPGRVYGGTARASAGVAKPRPSSSNARQSSARQSSSAREPGTRPSGTRGSSARDSRTRDQRNRDRRAREPRPRQPGARGEAAEAEADQAGKPGRPRRRAPLWSICTLVAGVILTLLSGSAIAGYEALNNRYAGNIEQDNLIGDAAADPGEELEGAINLLLLGVEEQGEGARSDSIIVLHIPSSHDAAYLMSMPRDTYVEPEGFWGMKLTEAFNAGYETDGTWGAGARVVSGVISNLTGLRFNGAAIVNFGGFRKIIDEMGGLEFCVDTAAYSEHLVLVNGEPMGIGKARREGIWDYEEIRYEEGCQQMAGWQALDYARQRKTLASGEGDYGRQRHQVQLLQAMAKKATSPDVMTNLSTLDSLILAAGDALIVDTNGVELVDFLFTLRNLRPSDLVVLQTNRGEYQSFQVNGKSYERLSEESLAMFQAAANDTMADFIIHHPEVLAPTSLGGDSSTEDAAPAG